MRWPTLLIHIRQKYDAAGNNRGDFNCTKISESTAESEGMPSIKKPVKAGERGHHFWRDPGDSAVLRPASGVTR
jgi:hypothetical protein